MIRAACALACALLLGCAPHYIKSSDDAVAALVRDGAPVCSAFAIGPHELLTAAHCLGRDSQLKVTSRELWERTSSGAVPAEVVFVDEDRDLAFLRTKLTFTKYFTVREPRDGEKVVAIAAIYDWRRSSGAILPGAGYFRDSTLTIQHGWSGSPVVGHDGQVVGIVARCYGTYFDNVHRCNPRNAQFSVLP